MNLNELAKQVTLQEGKKISVSVAQVKEILKIILTLIAKLSPKDLERIFKRYR